MSASNWVHLDVEEVVRETEKAFLLRLENGEEVWVPRSQVDDPGSLAEGSTNCTVSVSEWWASKNGMT